MKNLTNKQLRTLIREELEKTDGYNELTLREKKELEEGLFDRFKAGAAGALAGGAAALKNVGAKIGGGARAALGAAKGVATGETQSPVEYKTYNATEIANVTKALSRIKGFLKQTEAAKANLRADAEKMTFPQGFQGLKRYFQAAIEGDSEALSGLEQGLEALKKGDVTTAQTYVKKMGPNQTGGAIPAEPGLLGRVGTTLNVPQMQQQVAEAIANRVVRKISKRY